MGPFVAPRRAIRHGIVGAVRIGIDLGGTKIEGILLGHDGAVLERKRVPTPHGSADDIVAGIAEVVRGLEAGVEARVSVGIGTPGALSPGTGLLRNSNTTVLNGVPLRELLEAALSRPVRMANDANCFALSEAVDGAAAGAAVVFGVIIGTGVGGGVVVRQRPLTGPNAIAGEWGHNPLPRMADDERPGPTCYCGRLGCIETFLSGPGLARDHVRHTGQDVEAPTIVEAAADGDPAADATLSRYEERLARALAVVINVLDPDVIVLGGGLSRIDRLYENVPRLWTPHVFSDVIRTRLVRPVHGDSSGVRGAAWLWPPG
jgi:fructokinase